MRKHPKHRNHTNPNFNIRPLSAAAVERLLYGESLPDKHAKERLQQARKEYAMPDMKTAMEKALSTTIQEWANDDKPNQQQEKQVNASTHSPNNFEKQPDGKVRFKETTGVSRAVFDYVNTHSGHTRVQVRNALIAKGYKKGSVDSLITQNVRSGIFLQDPNSKLYSLKTSYQSVPSTRAQRNLPKTSALKKAAPKVKTSAGIAALTPATTSTPAPAPMTDAQTILNTLSVIQARALYDELKKIFGG